MQKILIVDSNSKYAELLAEKLEKEGREISFCENSIEAIVEYVKMSFDVVITYYDMQGIDGIKVLATIRGINPFVRSVLLTDRCDDEIEMLAIENNVDIYSYRDKSIDVLSKRIEQILGEPKHHKLTGGKLASIEDGILIDASAHAVYKDGELVDLTRKEYDLLCLLLSNKGKALSREEILEIVWASSSESVNVRAIDGYIKILRKKLNLFQVSSVRGYGYVWN